MSQNPPNVSKAANVSIPENQKETPLLFFSRFFPLRKGPKITQNNVIFGDKWFYGTGRYIFCQKASSIERADLPPSQRTSKLLMEPPTAFPPQYATKVNLKTILNAKNDWHFLPTQISLSKCCKPSNYHTIFYFFLQEAERQSKNLNQLKPWRIVILVNQMFWDICSKRPNVLGQDLTEEDNRANAVFMCHDEVDAKVGFWRFDDGLGTKLCDDGLATKLCHRRHRRRFENKVSFSNRRQIVTPATNLTLVTNLVTKFCRQTVVTKFRRQTVAKPSKPNFGVHFVVAHEDSISCVILLGVG